MISATILKVTVLIALMTLMALRVSHAAPDMSTRMTVEGVDVVRDRDQLNRYYAIPHGISLAQAADGHPRLSFTVARYSGSRPQGDSGRVDILSMLRAGVTLDEPTPAQMQRVQQQLRLNTDSDIDLRRLAIQGMSASLLYTNAGSAEDLETERNYSEGLNPDTIWTRRDIVMGFAPFTAQLIEHVLETGSTGLSLVWTISALVWQTPDSIVEGTPDLISDLSDSIDNATSQLDQQPRVVDIANGAFALRLSEAARESRLIHYDIDAALPPSYPSLAAYCFTFKDSLYPELYSRTVEIEASGIGGRTMRTSTRFGIELPGETASTIVFSRPVDLRMPYRWRIVDLLHSGEGRTGEWVDSDSWASVIDVTALGLPAIEPEVQCQLSSMTEVVDASSTSDSNNEDSSCIF